MGRNEDRVPLLVAVSAFFITLTTIVCMVWWPLPTAAAFLAASGVWAVTRP